MCVNSALRDIQATLPNLSIEYATDSSLCTLPLVTAMDVELNLAHTTSYKGEARREAQWVKREAQGPRGEV
jgi:hypothetical protein